MMGRISLFFLLTPVLCAGALSAAQPWWPADAAPAARGRELLAFMETSLFVANGTVTAEYSNARGLAVYAPVSAYNPEYSGGAWADASGWEAFAQWYAGVRPEEDSWFPETKAGLWDDLWRGDVVIQQGEVK